MSPITNTNDLIAFCDSIAHADFITVDTEFMRESTYWPKLCLIQAASREHAAIIDPLAAGLDLKPFLNILTDPAVLKVFHACRQDMEIFFNLGALPSPIVDTQVAAQAAGYGDQVAYDAFIRQELKIDVDKGSRFTDWSLRPLSESQLTYALGDVTHLLPAFEGLKARLEKQGRLAWVAEEMIALSSPSLYATEPEDAWKRLKPRKPQAKYMSVFAAVAAWRERTAQSRDLPRGRVIKDEAIDEIASQCPQSAQAFDRMRAIPKGFATSKFGIELTEVIAQALENPEKTAPKMPKREHTHPAPVAVLELLKVLLKIRCDAAQVAPKLVASSADLERLALDDKAEVPALNGWRKTLFGEDALRLKRGELAIVLNGNRAELVELE